MKSKKANTLKKQKAGRGIKGIVEGIIMQAMSDLWTAEETDDSIKFFSGDGFRICADIIGMNLHDQVKLLDLVHRIVDLGAAGKARKKGPGQEAQVTGITASRHVKLPDAAMEHGFRGVCSL